MHKMALLMATILAATTLAGCTQPSDDAMENSSAETGTPIDESGSVEPDPCEDPTPQGMPPELSLSVKPPTLDDQVTIELMVSASETYWYCAPSSCTWWFAEVVHGEPYEHIPLWDYSEGAWEDRACAQAVTDTTIEAGDYKETFHWNGRTTAMDGDKTHQGPRAPAGNYTVAVYRKVLDAERDEDGLPVSDLLVKASVEVSA